MTAIRAVLLSLGLLLMTTVAGCGSEPTRCDSPGNKSAEMAMVDHPGDGPIEPMVFILLCNQDKTVTIFDTNGDDYRSLEEFQTENEVLDYGDEISVPKDFPAVHDSEDDVEYMTVPGRVSNTWILWVVAGGVIAAIAVSAGVWWLLLRRRQARDSDGLGDDPPAEPKQPPEPV